MSDPTTASLAGRVVASAWPRPMFVAFMLVAAGCFLVGSSDVRAVAFIGADLAALAAIGTRVRATQPVPGDVWRLMLVAFGVYSLALVPWYLFPAYGHPLPLPSPVDAGFFVSYLLYARVLRRVSSRYVGKDRGAWLEVTIVSLGVSAPLWELWLHRRSSTGLSAAAHVTLVAYPTALLILFAVGLRLALLADRREPRQLLLLGWLGGELAGDLYLSVAGTAGNFSLRSPWLLLTWCPG